MNTIAAISTAMGAGGIGIIRMSGKECFDILDKIFEPAKSIRCGFKAIWKRKYR